MNVQDISAQSLKMLKNGLNKINVLLMKLQVLGVWDSAGNFNMDFLGV
jgi:hypothetical protein